MSKKSMVEHFSMIEDPRINRRKKHKLIDILVISVCAFLCKCETWVDVEEYGHANFEWLRDILQLENGIPSHDTFGRVFQRINPVAFNKAFYNWVKDSFEIKEGEIISIDGKYFRGTASDGNIISRPRKMLGTVNAWASKAGVALAQKKTDYDKSSEMKVFKDLIEILDVKNCVVTMDAAGCYAKTLNAVIEGDGDYCVSLKKNQTVMYKNAESLFDRKHDDVNFFEVDNNGHGRKEARKYFSLNVDETFHLNLEKKWKRDRQEAFKNIKSITKVVSTRKMKEKETTHVKYYLSSLENNVERLSEVIRSHWHIENRLHWSLDVAFAEDRSTVRKGYGSENMSLLRKLCLNLIKKENTSKRSVNGKRLKCCWQKEYLFRVLYGVVLEN